MRTSALLGERPTCWGLAALTILISAACSSEAPLDDAAAPTAVTTAGATTTTTSSSSGGGGMGGMGAGGTDPEGGGGSGGMDDGGFDEPLVCDGAGPRFATHVLATDFGPGADYGQSQLPGIVLGPPQGAGCCGGGLDVCALGNGGSIVLGFSGNGIVDGEGADFVVFENAFEFGDDQVFAELATVSVSEDGETWVEFPCTAVEAPYGTCAGHQPVYLDGDLADDEVLDPAVHGGDGFDLADVGLASARFVRITDRVDLADGLDGVFDLDAVGIVHPACP